MPSVKNKMCEALHLRKFCLDNLITFTQKLHVVPNTRLHAAIKCTFSGHRIN